MNQEKMTLYNGDVVIFEGCPSCHDLTNKFSVADGDIYQNDLVTLTQDWELPIEGFFVIATKRHVEFMSELTKEEMNEVFTVTNKTIALMREVYPGIRYNVLFEEKENNHFHVWLMPRHDWMFEIAGGNPTKNISAVFKHAKSNFINKETTERIRLICGELKAKMNATY